jgi:Tol biopolymer transport system component
MGIESKDWSPDGTRLAFMALQEGASGVCLSDEIIFCGSRVFVAATDGSTGAIQIGDPDLDAREAAWSPDGASIAFGAGGGPQDIRLHVMDSDGGSVRAVSDLQGEMWALNQIDWSPDGRSVAGTTGLPTWDIWAIPVDGGTEVNVSGPSWSEDEPVDRRFPAYAADGAIAWTGGWGQESCACLTLREGDADPVNLPEFEGIPTWSPDGRFLVTASANPTAGSSSTGRETSRRRSRTPWTSG